MRWRLEAKGLEVPALGIEQARLLVVASEQDVCHLDGCPLEDESLSVDGCECQLVLQCRAKQLDPESAVCTRAKQQILHDYLWFPAHCSGQKDQDINTQPIHCLRKSMEDHSSGLRQSQCRPDGQRFARSSNIRQDHQGQYICMRLCGAE